MKAAAAPDLTCTITAVPDAKTGTAVLTVSIRNDGDAVATQTLTADFAFATAYSDLAATPTDEKPDYEISLPELNPLQEVSFDYTTTQLGVGTFKAWCWANPEYGPPFGRPVPDEIQIENNTNSVVFAIGEPPAKAPDLTITALTAAPVPGGGDYDVAFTVTVHNQGDEVAGPFAIDVYVGYTTEPDWETASLSPLSCLVPEGLDPGQKKTLSCASYNGWSEEDIGQQQIFAFADLVGEVDDELDRSNNDFSATITLTGPPDLAATDLDILTDKATVNYSVLVENKGGENVPDAQVCLFFNSDLEPTGEPSLTQTVSVDAGGAKLVSFERKGAGGGSFKAWVVLDCEQKLSELKENNNAISAAYDVEGIPNVAPIIESFTGPLSCTETVPCDFAVVATDETETPITFTIVDGPPGFFAAKDTGAVSYVPPLGSSAEGVSAVIRVTDAVGVFAEAAVTFDIRPSPNFEGVVGAAGSMPNTTSAVCPIVEVPGQGFAYVDRDAQQVRFYAHVALALAKAASYKTITLGLKHVVPGAHWSCTLLALEGGGLVAFETDGVQNGTPPTAVILSPRPDDKAIAKIPLTVVSGAFYSETFVLADASTLVFLSLDGVQSRLIFMDVKSLKLSAAWGGNNLAGQAGKGTPGILPIWDPVPATPTSPTGMNPYASYLWADADSVRIYNKHFSRHTLNEYGKDGSTGVATDIQPFLPPAAPIGEEESWSLFAAPDGGLKIVDPGSGTLSWFAADLPDDPSLPLTFRPVDAFSLKDPDLPVEAPPEPGRVFLQAYGLSANNIACSSVTSGGFACHDVAEQRGFVLNEFANYWKNCPVLDIGPTRLDFGAVASNTSRTLPVRISNRGGGTLVIDSVSVLLPVVSPPPSGSFVSGQLSLPHFLPPGESLDIQVTFSPKKNGTSLSQLSLGSNACSALTVDLVGVSGARLQVKPNPITFTGVTPGVHTQTVELVSVGSTALNLSSVTITGSATLSLLVPVPPKTLQPGERLSLEIEFDGTAAGAYVGKLVVQSNDATAATTEAPITASTTAKIGASPAGWGFGSVAVGNTLKSTITLRNRGFTPMQLQAAHLVAGSDFLLDDSALVSVLKPGEETTIALTFRPTSPGTAFALVVIEHDAPFEPPIFLHAVAGTGTVFPLGFQGAIPLDAAAGGPFEGVAGVGDALLHLTTGGFAVSTTNGDHILVITGAGQADSWFGNGGVVDVRAAFPEITSPLTGMIELADGGFAFLDREGERVVAIRADGSRHAYVGSDGVLEFGPIMAGNAVLGRGFIQTAGGSFAVIDSQEDQIIVVNRDGLPDGSFSNGAGVIDFRGVDAVAGDGLATGIGDMLANLEGRFVVGDDATDVIYLLSSDGLYVNQSLPDAVDTFLGTVAAVDSERFLYLQPGVGVITRHTRPTFPVDVTYGTGGELSVADAFTGVSAGAGLAAVDSQLAAVIDAATARILIIDQDATPYVAEPDAVLNPPDALEFGVVPVGTTSAPQSISVTNNGKLPLNVTALFDAPGFSLLAVGGVVPTTESIQPGGTKQVNVVFSPTHEGQFGAGLRLATDDPKLPVSKLVVLTGSTGARIVVEPDLALVDFGAVAIGGSETRVFSIRNAGADAVDITAAVVSATPANAFRLKAPGLLEQTLEPGAAAVVFSVEFTPSKAGEAWGALTIPIAGAGKPPVKVSLAGRVGAVLHAEPSVLRCEGAMLGQRTLCGMVSLSNAGSAPLIVAGAGVEGDGFEVLPVSGTIPPAGVPLEIPVFVTPGSIGTTHGTLRIVHGGLGAAGTTAIPLVVDAGTAVVVTPGSIDFGAIAVGSTVVRSVIVAGVAGTTLLAASTTGSVAFGVVAVPTLPAPLDQGPAEVQVRCNPATAGTFEGKLRIATDAPGQPTLEIPLHCAAGAVVSLEPSSLDFGAVSAGQSRSLPVRIVNSGLVPIGGLTATVSGEGFDPLTFTASIAPGQFATAFVVFRPTSPKEFTGTFSVSIDQLPAGSVALRGISGARLVAVAGADGIDFGIHAIGSKTRRGALVTNIGSDPLSISPGTVGAGGPFSVTASIENTTLSPGDSVFTEVEFAPLTVGTFGGALTFPTGGLDLVLPLSGRAGGALSVSPHDLAFGTAAAGQAQTLPLVVRNLGTNNAIVVHYFESGDTGAFEIEGLADGDTLAPGEILTDVKVRFDPALAGDYAATLTFYSNQGVEDGSIDVQLTGKSGPLAKVVEPRSGYIGFESVPVGTPMARPLRIGAGGTTTLSLLGVSFSGDSAFSVEGLETLPRNVTPGQVADLTVRCIPPKPGEYSADLQVATDDPTLPVVRVRLECRTPPALVVSPSAVEFGAVAALATVVRTVVVENRGTSLLRISGLEVQHSSAKTAFDLTAPFEGEFDIAAGKNVSIGVKMRPSAAAEYRGVLRITSSDPTRPVYEASLRGISGPHLVFDPPVIDYCHNNGEAEVKVVNAGSAPLVIEGADFLGTPDASVSAVWKGATSLTETTIDVGAERTLVLTYGGITGGQKVVAEALVFTSNDALAAEVALPITMGEGLSLPDGFDATADVLPPGTTPAFAGIGALNGGFGELCAGGFVAASVGNQSLYYAYPQANGAASAILDLGDAGVVDLSGWGEGALAGDLGAVVRTFPGVGLHAILSPSAGLAFLVHMNGDRATGHASGGTLDVGRAAGAPVWLADVVARGKGFVALDARGLQLVGLTEAGVIDPTFGTAGFVKLGVLFPGTTNSLQALATIPGGSIAVLDSQAARIVVVKPAGTVDAAFGLNGSGSIDLSSDGGFVGGLYGTTALQWFQPGFAVLDIATGQLATTTAAGLPNNSPGKPALIQVTGGFGAFGSGVETLSGALLVTDPLVAASPANANKFVLVDALRGDLLFVDIDGSGFGKGQPSLKVEGCPAVISDVAIGLNKTAELTLTNSGEGFLEIDEITVTSGQVKPTEIKCMLDTAACAGGGTIGAAASKKVTLTWNPTVGGCYAEEAIIAHNGGNGPATICPIQLGTKAVFQLTPGGVADGKFYAFPSQAVGSSFVKEFIVRNAGCAPMALNKIVLGGAGLAQFVSPATFAPKQLAPGEAFKFQIACKPTIAGVHESVVGFDPPSLNAGQTTLRCATGPLIEVSPGQLTWFGVPPGTSENETLTLKSTGGADAHITSVEGELFRIIEQTVDGVAIPEGPDVFTVVQAPDTGAMPIGTVVQVLVGFSPPGAGSYKAKLQFTSDSYDAVGVKTILLLGSSAPEIVFDPAPLDFGRVGVGETKELIVYLHNIGGSVANGYEPKAADLTGWFSVVDPSKLNINPETQANPTKQPVKIRCSPDAAGEQKATLWFDAPGALNAVDDQISLELICRGGNCLDVAPVKVDFGDVPWTATGEADVTLTNSTAASITASLAVTGGDTSSEFGVDVAEVTVLAKESKVVKLVFDPVDTPGKRHGELTITTATCDTPELKIPLVAWSMPPGDEPGGDVGPGDSDVSSGDAAPADGSDASDGSDGSDAGDAADATDSGDGSTPPPSSVEAYDGCGCDLASKRGLPVGPVALILLGLVAWGRWRTARR